MRRQSMSMFTPGTSQYRFFLVRAHLALSTWYCVLSYQGAMQNTNAREPLEAAQDLWSFALVIIPSYLPHTLSLRRIIRPKLGTLHTTSSPKPIPRLVSIVLATYIAHHRQPPLGIGPLSNTTALL